MNNVEVAIWPFSSVGGGKYVLDLINIFSLKCNYGKQQVALQQNKQH